MNHQSSIDTSTSSVQGSDAVSRRAYELWEKEGRPDGSDLRHWLQAEQELGSGRGEEGASPESGTSIPINTSSDVRPLQGTRAAAAANREAKRGSNAPFVGERTGNGQQQSAARRKPSSAPAL